MIIGCDRMPRSNCPSSVRLYSKDSLTFSLTSRIFHRTSWRILKSYRYVGGSVHDEVGYQSSVKEGKNHTELHHYSLGHLITWSLSHCLQIEDFEWQLSVWVLAPLSVSSVIIVLSLHQTSLCLHTELTASEALSVPSVLIVLSLHQTF